MVTNKLSNENRHTVLTNKFKKPNFIMFCDLDETLFNHNDRQHYWYHQLENYLISLRSSNVHFLFCIVTGCNLNEALFKLKQLDIKCFPDILAVGFGTQLFYYSENELIKDIHWQSRIANNYSLNSVYRIVDHLKGFGIELIQEKRSFNELKESYYYFPHNNKYHRDLRIIRMMANHNNIKAIISKCNANIGDPVDAYDIDFVPCQSGKEKVAKYIIKNTNINKRNTLAFGDSENDLPLIKCVHHGFAVANATSNMKKYNLQFTRFSHAQGILDQLIRHLERK